jgi:hypothetical protein
MPLFLAGNNLIFFAHVPKSGGSSVEEYLLRRFGVALLRERFDGRGRIPRGDKPHRGIIVPVNHLAKDDLVALLPETNVHSFALVRNPIARISSEYRFQAGRSKISRVGFPIWLRTVLSAAGKEPRIYQNHIRPQSDLVPEDAEVFRLEDGMDNLVEWIDRTFGKPFDGTSIQHLQKSTPIPLKLYRQDITLLRDFYAEDFRRFGYASPDPNDFPGNPAAWLQDAVGGALGRMLVYKQRRDLLS